jgi:L-iditol 2-dehydrogenase
LNRKKADNDQEKEESMKAAFYSAQQKIGLTEIDEPAVPHDGLKIQVKACAVCGSDLRRWREGPVPGAPTVIPGHEIAGAVVEVGKNCADILVGERLALGPDVHCGRCFYCQRGHYNLCDNLVLYGITHGYNGGLAEQMILPHDLLTRGICHRIPDGLSDEAAALAEPCASVIACHRTNGTTLGDLVVVMGAGPIGCLHAIIARAHGARVIVSEPNPIRRTIAEQFEPLAVVDPLSENLKSIVHRYSNSIGADKVICANPAAATQQQAVEIVRKGGEVILFGGLPKANPMTTLDANRIHYDQIKVIGSFSYHPTHHALALDFLVKGIIPADKIITAVYPLTRVQQAFEAAGDGKVLKIIIKPTM